MQLHLSLHARFKIFHFLSQKTLVFIGSAISGHRRALRSQPTRLDKPRSVTPRNKLAVMLAQYLRHPFQQLLLLFKCALRDFRYDIILLNLNVEVIDLTHVHILTHFRQLQQLSYLGKLSQLTHSGLANLLAEQLTVKLEIQLISKSVIRILLPQQQRIQILNHLILLINEGTIQMINLILTEDLFDLQILFRFHSLLYSGCPWRDIPAALLPRDIKCNLTGFLAQNGAALWVVRLLWAVFVDTTPFILRHCLKRFLAPLRYISLRHRRILRRYCLLVAANHYFPRVIDPLKWAIKAQSGTGHGISIRVRLLTLIIVTVRLFFLARRLLRSSLWLVSWLFRIHLQLQVHTRKTKLSRAVSAQVQLFV